MFKIGKRRKKKKRIFRFFKKFRHSHNRKNKLSKTTEVIEVPKELETTLNSINTNSNNTKIKHINKKNHEYVDRIRNQVKEVLEEKYDESFDNLFNEFENNGFVNKDNFLFRLIFMILKKYGFIDIFDEDGNIDPNAIDAILKSVIKDAYQMVSEDEKNIDIANGDNYEKAKEIDIINNDNNNYNISNVNNIEYKSHFIEETCSNTYNDSFYEDE